MSSLSLLGRIMAVLSLLGVFAGSAFAGGSVRSCGYQNVWRHRGCFDSYRRMYYDCYVNEYACSSSCAPQAEKGNLAATQSVLEKLSASSEFASAPTFKATVARIGAIENSSVRFGEYMVLVGLENSNQDELLEFLGARTPDAKAVASAKEKLGLTDVQADTLIKEVARAMRGSLN